MITPPRYKTARRLGASVYEKTQTPKFTLRTQQRSTKKGFSRQRTDYGVKVLEKQRVRFSYGLNERQFSRYVREANESGTKNHEEFLYSSFESRLDNVIYRSGFAPTRQSARQMVSHGHILVNGKKTNMPSFKVSPQDVIAIRAGSLKKKLFENLEARLKEAVIPTWISSNPDKKEAVIQSFPKPEHPEFYSTLGSILEFYRK